MKVLFCHDGPLRRDENNNYYGTAHNDSSFKRYYTIGNELSALIRVNPINGIDAINKLSKITISPFKVIQVPNISSVKGQIKDKRRAKEIIAKEISENDFIVIRMPSIIGGIALSLAKKMNKKYVVELVACSWDSLWNHSIKGKMIAPFQFYLTKYQIYNSQNVIYITKNFLQKRYPTKGNSYICPNVSLKIVDDNLISNRISRFNNIHHNGRKIIIGSTGAINIKYKGHDYMLKALSRLIKEGYNVEYHIVGGGDKNYISEKIIKYGLEGRVKLLGPISHEKIFNFLDSVDIYIQPSLAEAQGRSLIEAMSRGCLCICTNVGGMPELIETTFIARKKNSNSLAEKVKDILSSDIVYISKDNIFRSLMFQSDLVEKQRTEILQKIFYQ